MHFCKPILGIQSWELNPISVIRGVTGYVLFGTRTHAFDGVCEKRDLKIGYGCNQHGVRASSGVHVGTQLSQGSAMSLRFSMVCPEPLKRLARVHRASFRSADSDPLHADFQIWKCRVAPCRALQPCIYGHVTGHFNINLGGPARFIIPSSFALPPWTLAIAPHRTPATTRPSVDPRSCSLTNSAGPSLVQHVTVIRAVVRGLTR